MKKTRILALSILGAFLLTGCNIIPDFGPVDNDISSETSSNSDSSSGSSSSSSSSGSSSSSQSTLTLTSITLGTKKTTYYVGDDFVMPKVTAKYSDNSTKIVTSSAEVQGFNSSTTTNSQQITISYTENGVTKSAAPYNIAIIALSSISVSGQKTEYYVGESFVMPTVTAHYSNSSSKTVTGATQSGFNSSAAVVSQTITISFTDHGVTKTTSYS